MKYACDVCNKKVEWAANGRRGKKKEDFGQQRVAPGYKIEQSAEQREKGMVTIDGKEAWYSSILLLPREFHCYKCAKENGWDIFDEDNNE